MYHGSLRRAAVTGVKASVAFKMTQGWVLNKTEVALPLHFVQDATVYRSWLGVGRVDVSTAGGEDSAVFLHPPEDARRLADIIISQAKCVALDHMSSRKGADPTTDALVRLGQLRDAGVLTEDEFAQQKARPGASHGRERAISVQTTANAIKPHADAHHSLGVIRMTHSPVALTSKS